MEEHLQRHTAALDMIRALCASGMDAVEAVKVVVEEFGRDALRASPDETDWNTAHHLVDILVREYNAEFVFAMDLATTLFGREALQDLCDMVQRHLRQRLFGESN